MVYKIDKAKFANDPLYETLASLQKTLEQLNLQLYVVGACARDIAMKVLKVPASARRTADVDVAIALGMTTKEIAEKRFSSFHTVNTHRKNIFRKLGVNNVHEATKYALRAGLIDSAEYYI